MEKMDKILNESGQLPNSEVIKRLTTGFKWVMFMCSKNMLSLYVALFSWIVYSLQQPLN